MSNISRSVQNAIYDNLRRVNSQARAATRPIVKAKTWLEYEREAAQRRKKYQEAANA